MPSVTKYFQSKYDFNFNALLVWLLILMLIANGWLVAKKIDAGIIFWTFLVSAMIGIFFIQFSTKGEPMQSNIGRYLRAPFETSNALACFSYLAGFSIAIIVQTIMKLINAIIGTGFSITSFSIPLFSGDLLSGISQSFATVEVANSMPWKLFILVYDAGTSEEFIFSFAIMFIMTAFLLLLFQKTERPLGFKKDNFVIILAMILSTILFVGAHQLNSTYSVGYMFLIAGIFKLVSIIGIYFYGLFLTFWIGFHQSNNLMYLIETEGFIQVINGMFSWFGLVFFGTILVCVLYLLLTKTGLKEVWAYITS